MPPVRVRVLAVRPSDDDGELHGLYEPDEDGPARAHHRLDAHRAAASRWSRSGRSCARSSTSSCHHLDYEHFKLPETFHTEGFYKRESSLANALFAQDAEAAAAPGACSEPRSRRRRIAVECAPLPEERCNSRPPRAQAARLGVIHLSQPRSLNRDSRTG